MKKLLIIALLFASCESNKKKGIITYKSICIENPHFAEFRVYEDVGYNAFIDSANKYQIGDSVNKYSRH
jgi:hypothetical protein